MTLASLLPFLAASEARAEGTFWMPEQASTFAEEVDWIYYFIYWIDVLFFFLVIGAMVYFAIRYRAKTGKERTSPLKGSHSLELAWSAIPGLILLSFFWFGFQTYMDMQVPPKDALNIRVTGQKWNWSFEYPDYGIRQGGDQGLVVPSGQPVMLTMSSVDVLHSFYIPDFRVKKDVVPNRYSTIWFEAKGTGDHQVFCTEYCGDDHSRMLTKVHVMEPAKFREWVRDNKADDGPVDGQSLFSSMGCIGCHSIDGSKLVGPSLKGKYGTDEQLTDGSTVAIDDNYIRESIMVPGAKVVAGYAPQMPPYQGRLNDEEVNALIDYIKTLK
ncbi:MAG: cytochrome c oxidase subunit II [Alphaproteobacteria bacterium]|nr:cytochrome c oxidase subunit II [Alphaproteobacteria bacterium]